MKTKRSEWRNEEELGVYWEKAIEIAKTIADKDPKMKRGMATALLSVAGLAGERERLVMEVTKILRLHSTDEVSGQLELLRKWNYESMEKKKEDAEPANRARGIKIAIRNILREERMAEAEREIERIRRLYRPEVPNSDRPENHI